MFSSFPSPQYKGSDPNKPETVRLNSGEQSTVRTGSGLSVSGLVPQSTIDAIAGIDVAKQKVAIVGAVGDKLGLQSDHYPSADDYEKDVVNKLQLLKQSPDGKQKLDDIVAKLGLDKLGVSIDTLIGAVNAPGGEDDQRLANSFRSGSDIERRYQEVASEYARSHGGDGTYGPSGVFSG
ncbi:hypothetical protein [Rhizobium leguminosarum]|uniref:hypothetical protein n=1 Tax=Rhizobium leguminosarum TaxID=384 RepID=UPI00143F16F3|nr:hypothetical protein [Rhizobium leguminosarum]NKL23891.1 hypothetical protein [Rhizobium leguminosarum bv. viciae]